MNECIKSYIKFKSNTIGLMVHTSCYCILDFLCVNIKLHWKFLQLFYPKPSCKKFKICFGQHNRVQEINFYFYPLLLPSKQSQLLKMTSLFGWGQYLDCLTVGVT